MKKLKKQFVFIIFFAFALTLTYYVNANETVKLKKVQNIEKDAFFYDFAVDKNFIYYAKKVNNTFYIMKRDILKNSNPEIVYIKKALDEDFKKIDFTNINGNLFAKIHKGAALMGEDIFLNLSKKPVKNTYISSYESLAIDKENKNIHLPFWAGIANEIVYEKNKFPLEKDGYYVFETQKSDDNFKITNSKFFISDKEIVLLKNNKTKLNPYDICIFNFEKNKEIEVQKNVSNIAVEDGCVYFTVKNEKNSLQKFYRYEGKTGKIQFLFETNPYDDMILSLGESLIFTGRYPNTNGQKNNSLFIYKNNRLSCFYTGDINYFFCDGKNIAVVVKNGQNSKVMIFDKSGKNISNITVPISDIKLYISDKNMVIWSYIDQKARYYTIN